jgi:Holliday junction resolvase
MKTKESEKTLEARLVREIEARGGMALKYTSQFHRGIPDRICLLPGGLSVFVELKSTGKKPTKLQQYAMDRLDAMGHPTCVVDRTEKLEELLKILDEGITRFAKI